MSILALNAGSSSLKFALFDEDAPEAFESGRFDLERESIDLDTAANRAIAAARAAASGRGAIAAVGHRIVHGGPRFKSTTLLDSAVEDEIARLAELAPLHNPPAIRVLHAARRALPSVPHAAVFDTSFFSDLPPRAHVYPLPWEWYSEGGIRRYGFHGLSHESAALRVAELAAEGVVPRRIVTCHLGQGCSAAALLDGRPVTTTMGLTPIEGLMMGSRSGSIDPGILIEELRRNGGNVDAIEDALVHRSGLLGVSGVSSDFRKVQAAADSGHVRAGLALAIYGDRLAAAIAALAAALGGLDAIVFTGGVGENSSSIRAEACGALEFAGVRLDSDRNATSTPDAEVSAPDSAVKIYVLRAREEWMIAKETRKVLGF